MAVQQATSPEMIGSAGGIELLKRKPQTFWGMAISALRRDRLTLVALGFVVLIGLLAIFAGSISSALGVNPYTTNLANKFQAPYLFPYIEWRMGIDTTTAPEMLFESDGVPHWLGTDQLGRDLLSRLLYGARISLSIALIAAAIAMVVGVFFGTIAGYFGGRMDDIFMWLINTVTSIPDIYLLIIINAIFRPNAVTLTLFLGFLGWFGTARFMRGNVLKVRTLDYTLAAQSIGSSASRIMRSHIIPNCIPVIIVITFIDVGALILTESILSFLGVGVPAPTPSWGNMLNGANEFLTYRDPVTQRLAAIHLVVLPGILTTLTVLSFYLIGDGLRDALDPMLKNKK
jgi:peptide/nickel transport system permease protein